MRNDGTFKILRQEGGKREYVYLKDKVLMVRKNQVMKNPPSLDNIIVIKFALHQKVKRRNPLILYKYQRKVTMVLKAPDSMAQNLLGKALYEFSGAQPQKKGKY